MNTLDELRKLEKEKRENEKADREAWDRRNKAHEEAEENLFNKFLENIKPFDNETINGSKIKLIINKPKKTIEFIVNGIPFVKFSSETKTQDCNCSACWEGYTGHESSYSQHIKLKQIHPQAKKLKDVYFDCRDMNDKKRFASAVLDLMEKYESKRKWGSL